jgi:hypothetical protein
MKNSSRGVAFFISLLNSYFSSTEVIFLFLFFSWAGVLGIGLRVSCMVGIELYPQPQKF